jgi:hypothetical protein
VANLWSGYIADSASGDERRVEVVTDRVDHHDVYPVGVERVVEAVAGDLVGGLEHAGDRHLRGHERHRRQARSLQLGRERHRVVPPHVLDRVGVVALRYDQHGRQPRQILDRRHYVVVDGVGGQVDRHDAEAGGAVDHRHPEAHAAVGLGGMRALPGDGRARHRGVDVEGLQLVGIRAERCIRT